MKKAVLKNLLGVLIAIRVMIGQDKTAALGKERILGLFVQSVKRNAKFLLNLVEAVLYFVVNVLQEAINQMRTIEARIKGMKKEIFQEIADLVKGR